MLSEEEVSKYKEAGKIVARLREDMLKSIKPGQHLLDIANKIEDTVFKAGARPAFPVNIGVNEAAAHYTPQIADTKVVNEGDLVKIDMGAHIDGYLADMAFTYCSEKSPLIDAAEKALKAGISVIRPGVSISEISAAIHDAIETSGFGPVVNLSGHGIGRYNFHGDFSVPNVRNTNEKALKEGEVLALEPFVCESSAHVDESEPVEIFQFAQSKPVRSIDARKILSLAEKEYGGFPFPRRWLVKHVSPFKIKMALLELEKVGAVTKYPVLKDMQGRKIAQAEDTIIVADKPIVTTRI
ncbi:MAG: type II methionyl aminopeptidase [Candidatus Aenigmatarchaeota archaeon]|nr:MAG: type II methionyl aminopeptidase [Candidatus Aenigmarchaeota archaeon]